MGNQTQEPFITIQVGIGPTAHHQNRAVFMLQTAAAIFQVLHDKSIAFARVFLDDVFHRGTHQLHVFCEFFFVGVVYTHQGDLMWYSIHVKS